MSPREQQRRVFERKIRWAEAPDTPQLIHDWLLLCGQDSWQSNEDQFCLLMETAFDELLPRQWRIACLDNICWPLRELSRLARTEPQKRRLRALTYELSVGGQYFTAGLR
ncbi:hypothetical protein [Thalassolituus sp.]|jgi:hypothetical protein|uniref:hypothetical protein n=1 Tax=Thalassolituus sp. TaxID=2030822 RepID=UPI0035147263|nr:MAG: hypothetical protein CSH36_05475 [Thalassolituus sp.]